MRRQFTVAALSATTFAASVLVAPLIGVTPAWATAPANLRAAPGDLVPAAVSALKPVTVVRTTLDKKGRPVVTKQVATSRAAAKRLVEQAQKAPRAIAVELDAPVSALDADPMRADQWDLTKIRTPDAWNSATGEGVIVAVLDTGVDAGHADLAGQVLPGKNMITGATGVSSDVQGHGTHVAGTIAAATGNGVGVAGNAPGAKILPVKVLGDNGSGYMSDVATGIIWAADNGARVLNMSLGSASKTAAVTNAIAYARSKNVVVVAAAGNERASKSPVSYPGADAGVIAVAATDSSDKYASFSNAGSYVDLAAPGVGILSTVPGGGYSMKSGTSMASPHVAALAALLLAKKSTLTPDQVEQAMQATAVDLGSKGKDKDYGSGRIDAVAALGAVGEAVVTSEAESQQVLYGTTVETEFTVTVGGAPAAKRGVQLCIDEKDAGFKCRNATTTADGTVSLSRKVTAPYQVRLVVPAAKTNFATGESDTYSYTVRSAVSLTATKKDTLVMSQTGAAKQADQLQQSVDGETWTTVRTFSAGNKVTFNKMATGFKYRVVVPDVPQMAGSVSESVQL